MTHRFNNPSPTPQVESVGSWDRVFGGNFTSRSNPGSATKSPTFQDLFQNFNIPSRLATHLYNIYSTMAIMIGLAAVGVCAAWNTPPHPWIWGIANFGAMLWFAFSSPHQEFLTINLQSVLLYVIAGTTGILSVPLMRMAHFEAPMAIPLALIATTIVYGALTIAAFKADRASVLYYWSSISLVIGALGFYSTVIMLFGMDLLPQALWSTIGIAMSCFVVILDTQTVLYQYEQNPDVELDYKQASLTFFWSFAKLFMRILQIMIKLMKKDDNKNNNDNRSDRRNHRQ